MGAIGDAEVEKAAWNAAWADDDPAVWRAFIAAHPHSPRLAQARARLARLEERDWNDAASRNTVEAWVRFLTVHADSPRASDARTHLNEVEATLDERRTLTGADVETREIATPDPARTVAAQSKRSEVTLTSAARDTPAAEVSPAADTEPAAWLEASRADTPEAWRRFIREHGDSPRIADAVRRRDEAEEREADETDWDTTKRLRTRAALERYLTEHPFGRHVKSARAALEKLHAEETAAFREAARQGTVGAWERFLGGFPDGRLVADARAALESARERQREESGRRDQRVPAKPSRDAGSGWDDHTVRETLPPAAPAAADQEPREWATIGPALKRLSRSAGSRLSTLPVVARVRELTFRALEKGRRRPRLVAVAGVALLAAIALAFWSPGAGEESEAPSPPPPATGLSVLRQKRYADGRRVYYGARTNFVMRNDVRLHDFLKRLGDDAHVWFAVDASALEWVTSHPPATYDASSTPWDEAFERVIRLNRLTYRVDNEKVVVSGPSTALRGVLVYLPPEATPPRVIHPVPPGNPQLTLPATGAPVRTTFAVQCVVRRDGTSHCLVPYFVEGNSADRTYASAIDAVLGRWRFDPAEVNGRSVDALLTLRFAFPEFGPVGIVTSYEPW